MHGTGTLDATLSVAEVRAAATRIAGAVVRTPTLHSKTLSAITGAWPGRPAQSIEQYLSGLSLPMLAVSFVMGIFGLTLLGWPAARGRREVNS